MKLSSKFLAFFLFIFAFATPSYAQYSGATQSYKPEGFWMLRKKGKDGRYYNHSKIRVYRSDVAVMVDKRGNEVFNRNDAVRTEKRRKLFAKLIEYYPNKTAKCCSDARYSDKENYPEHYTSLANKPLRGVLLFKGLSRDNKNELVWEGKAKTSNYVWFQKMENLVGIDDSEENHQLDGYDKPERPPYCHRAKPIGIKPIHTLYHRLLFHWSRLAVRT